MDSLHAIGFYVSAAISIGGGLLVAFVPGRGARGVAVGVSGLGIAGLYASLSTDFAGLAVLVCYAGCALLIAGPRYRIVDSPVGFAWRQVGAVAAAGLFAVLSYAAFRGDFVEATYRGGEIGAAAVGRVLFVHDALATEAVGVLILIALVGATAAWRVRDRGR
ncbi:MAG: NADH-quinone oxidoreductase subunit J family protein [Candidatus Dormibacteraceae bacterium]